ncbi:MAG TPA: hypothetical protein EYP29_01290, partial [Thermoplasmata archaeon]|nr:hypothetical protein [Thermoplasmata archaeon]
MKPKVSKNCFISQDASIIGNVEIEEGVNIWPHVSIRADLNKITIKKGANVQDCCVIHVTKEHETIIGENVSVGHGAVVHGAIIGKNTIIGMNATVLDGAKIGEGCIIGANALVKNRRTESKKDLKMRLDAARSEIEFYGIYDYVIVN